MLEIARTRHRESTVRCHDFSSLKTPPPCEEANMEFVWLTCWGGNHRRGTSRTTTRWRRGLCFGSTRSWTVLRRSAPSQWKARSTFSSSRPQIRPGSAASLMAGSPTSEQSDFLKKNVSSQQQLQRDPGKYLEGKYPARYPLSRSDIIQVFHLH